MRTRKATQRQDSKLLRFVTLPIRALGKARDLYVRSLTSCAGRVSYGGSAGPVYADSLPRSFSAASSTACGANDDFKELLRAASAKSLGMIEVDHVMVVGPKGLPKSCSLGMGRIDEDEPCEFGDGAVAGARIDEAVYRRSRSYAVTGKSNGF